MDVTHKDAVDKVISAYQLMLARRRKDIIRSQEAQKELAEKAAQEAATEG